MTNLIPFFREIGKNALDLIQSEKKGREIVGKNPLGQHTLRMDQALEDLVVKKLKEEKLGTKIISEESGELSLPGNKRIFLLDPLDGSNNYLRGVPCYALAISAATGNYYSDITHSYVINLATGDEFWSISGKKVWMNSKKIHTSKESNLRKCVIEYDNNMTDMYDILLPLLRKVKDIRRFGANALGLCYVANGSHQAFIDLRRSLSIVHAPALKIAEEAGAIVTDARDIPVNPALKKESKLSFICSGNRRLHDQILLLLKGSSMYWI